MNEYAPDEVSPPGESLQDWMDERGMSIADLAALSNLSEIEIKRILSGHLTIWANESGRLSVAFGVPATFWLERQRLYSKWKVEMWG